MKTLSQELQWRGFVNQTTFKNIEELDAGSINFYLGVDPSASSMTIGNLAAIILVGHFIDHGHKATLLVGGATGIIGDPDGKAEERKLKTLEEIEQNKKNIAKQYAQILGSENFVLVDNYEWFKDIGYLDFLRNVGKHVPMRQMLSRDFIKTRLDEDGSGISYAEFSYVLLQAYDFWYLNKTKDITLQLCGSDQWGNSIAGVDLIRRLSGKETNVFTTPLVINKSTGKKFGKSEEGAIWLDDKLTSVYKFYQFWLNLGDDGVEDYLKIYTLLSEEQIEEVITEFNKDRSKRHAQKTLAFEVTNLVHGKERAESVKRITEVLFGGANYNELSTEDFKELSSELPIVRYTKQPLVDILVEGKLAGSKGEARRFLEAGAVYINGEKSNGETYISDSQFINDYLLVRRGKNNQILVKNN